MATVRIEKYIGEAFETGFTVPAFAFAVGHKLLPETVLKDLAKGGVDVEQILAARKQGLPWSTTVEVCEHGVDKRVVVTLIN